MNVFKYYLNDSMIFCVASFCCSKFKFSVLLSLNENYENLSDWYWIK